MITNKKFLKNILATASTIAITIGGSIEAAAMVIEINQDASTSADLTNANAANNWANFTGNHTLTFDAEGTILGAFMDSPATISVDNNATIGSIAQADDGEANLATINIADTKTLTLNGTAFGAAPGLLHNASANGATKSDYSGLGEIAIGSNAAGDATLKITATEAAIFKDHTLINGRSGANPGSKGRLVVSGANHIFLGAINHLSLIHILEANNITFRNNVTSENIRLADGSTISVDPSSDNITITGGINGADDNNGTLAINVNDRNVTIADGVGISKTLAAINIAGTHNTTFSAAVKTAGDIDASNATGDVTFSSTVNAVNILTSSGITTFKADATATAFSIADDDRAIMKVESSDGDININGTINSAGNNNKGTLAINAATDNVTIAGAVGTTKTLAAINITGTHNTTFSAAVKTAGDIDATNATGEVAFDGDVHAINIRTGTGSTIFANGISNENVSGNVIFNGNVTATDNGFKINDDRTLTVNSENEDGDEVTITGTIDGANDDNGTLAINATNNNVTIAGAVGTTNTLAAINIAGAGNTTFSKGVKTAGNIDATDATGEVTFGQSVEAATIIIGQAQVTFSQTANVAANAINLVNNESIVNLDGDGDYIVPINGGVGTVHILSDITFTQDATITSQALNIGEHTLTIQGGAITANITGTNEGAIIAHNENNTITGNIGSEEDSVKITVSDATILTANSESIYATIIHLNNADAEFVLDGTNGNITKISTDQGVGGHFTATLNENGELRIGASGAEDHRINTLSITGNTADNTNVTLSGDIFAQNVTHKNATFNLGNNRTINAYESYTIDSANIDADTHTITVATPNLVLIGNIVISASYDEMREMPVLDLNGAAEVNADELTGITFRITGTPARNTTMIAISGANALEAIKNKLWIESEDNLWEKTSTSGQLIFNPTPPATLASSETAKSEWAIDEKSVGALQAQQIITSTFGGQGTRKNISGRLELDFIDTAKYTQDLSTDAGATALLATLTSPEIRKGFLDNYVTILTSLNTDNIVIPYEERAAFAIVAKGEGLIPAVMADAISQEAISGIDENLSQDVIKLYASEGVGKVVEMSDRITYSAQTASSIVLSSVSDRTTSVTLPTLSLSPLTIGAEEGAGIAAGSSLYDKFGVWGNVNIGNAVQKKRKNLDGFKSTSDAIVLGADTMINDSTMVGVAIANSMTNIKFKDGSLGNKTKTSSWIGSLYMNHQCNNDWFVRGSALLNSTNVHNKDRRVIAGGYGIAKSKYNFLSYGGEVNVGMTHRFANDILLTPTVGAKILHSNKVKYSETGDTNQINKNITQKATNSLYALAGLSVAKTFAKESFNLIPEAHVNFQYNMGQKSPKGSFVSALSPNITSSFTGTKSVALNSTYGVSLTGSNDRLEAGINADVTIASKYVGYQGGLKLRVKF